MHCRRVAQVAVSLALLAVLFTFVDLTALGRALGAARLGGVALGTLAMLAGVAVRALRWMLIVNTDERRVGYVDSFLVTVVGAALNVVLPGNTGEVAKVAFAHQRTGLRERALAGSVIDKLIALLAAGIIGLVPALHLRLWDLALCNSLLTLVCAALVYSPRALPWGLVVRCLHLVKVRIDLRELRQGARLGAKLHVLSLALSLAGWMLTFAGTYFMFESIAAGAVGLGTVLVVAPLTTVARLFPFTLDGLGAAEGVGVLLYTRYGVSPDMALLALLLSRAVGSYLVGLLGLLTLMLSRSKQRSED